MKRCTLCGGMFGLIRHRWHSRQFCSLRCRETFLNQIAKDRGKVRLTFSSSHGIAITTNLNESVN
jgi:hypothetical protein